MSTSWSDHFKDMDDEEVIQINKNAYNRIYVIASYGRTDLDELAASEAELDKRGYERGEVTRIEWTKRDEEEEELEE